MTIISRPAAAAASLRTRFANRACMHTPPVAVARSYATSASAKPSYTVIPDTLHLPLLTTQLKDRKTAKLVLSNGIKGVVISDSETPVTGAALSVEAGSWHDTIEGTAHFCEHMLFLGTKKFPSEHDYERFIFDSNGQMNGYTANDHSLYYFSDVSPSAFDGALDRFSRFFYEPLFNPNCVDREQNAVDQEFRKNIEQDGWRVLHVRKALANASHPFSAFNTGNLETMKMISQDTLKDWFRNHYSANLMHFTILGRDSVEVLAEKAEAAFGPIRNSDVSALTTTGRAVFPASLHRTLTWIEPIKNLRELTLAWEIPFKYNDDVTKPARLASHLIGYEGQNSLLSQLKKEELAEGLSAGKSHLGAENLLFEISVSLTEKGVKEWQTVVGRIFEGIASLQATHVPKHVFDQVNLVNKIGYQFQQRSSGIATQWCGLLRRESIETFPQRSFFISSFDPAATQALLGELTPDTCMYTMIAQKAAVPLDKTEKWMGAKYATNPIADGDLEMWKSAQPHPNVAHPAPNPYIPKHLALTARDSAPPQLLISGNEGKLYFFPDAEFAVPEAAYMFNIKTPKIRPDDARSIVLAALYTRFVHERLQEISYDAASAGLHFDVGSIQGDTGIALGVDGYSENAALLLQSLLEFLRNPRVTEHEFAVYLESLKRSYQNASKDSPLRQAMDKLSNVIHEKYCSPAMLAEAAEHISADDLRTFCKSLYDTRYMEAFVGGNLTGEEALAAWRLVQEVLPGTPCSLESVARSKAIPFPETGPTYLATNVPVKGNALVWALGLGHRDHKLRTGQELLSKLIKEPLYTELRTKAQTGYIVSSGGMQVEKQLFLQAVVQSNTHDPWDLLSRVELFHETFLRELVESGTEIQARFDAVKAAKLARLAQPYDTLAAKLRWFRYLAFEEDADFNFLDARIAAMKAYSLDDLREFAVGALGRENKRRMAVLASGNSEENAEFKWRAYSKL
ncbi:Metalloenzyme, LuxS/M16 peptidase-like protein [Geranomyces variabilis]|nr:Metalloenzyme, LuxS/M16 peptidase-like protein [Geranomyces variabilis]KAJ3143313.1 hypothetical protein HDU90_000071 [Geranomyces variabilis]